MLPCYIKKKSSFHLEVSQGFPSTTSNDSVKLVYPRLLWPKVKEPLHGLDMSGIMLRSLSGDWTVEKSGFLNSWLGPKHARFDISGGKRESRQKALEERWLFLDQHVKFSAWWFRQRLPSSSYSLHWSCCMAVKERLGPSETKRLTVGGQLWASSEVYLSIHSRIWYIRDEQQTFFPSGWLSYCHEFTLLIVNALDQAQAA